MLSVSCFTFRTFLSNTVNDVWSLNGMRFLHKYLYRHDVYLLSTDAVLECWWVGGALGCYTKSGFEYDKKLSRTFNITIRHVTSARTGTYGCQVDGYGSSDLGKCQLNLTLGMSVSLFLARIKSLQLN